MITRNRPANTPRRYAMRSWLTDPSLKTYVRPGVPGSGTAWSDVMGANNVTLATSAGTAIPWAHTVRGLVPQMRTGSDRLTVLGSQIATTGTEVMWLNLISIGTTDSQPTLIMSGSHYWAIKGSTSQLEFFNGAWRVASSGVIKLNTWHMAAICHTTSDTKMYLDGIEVYSGAQTIGAGAATTYIGARGDELTGVHPYAINGYVSDVLFYSRMLSASEIANLYALTK